MQPVATRGCAEEASVNLLALDSASTACSAAVLTDGAVVAERFAAMDRGQAEALVPMIADVLAAAAIEATALAAVAVTVGPGAFTGVRIGLAAARGLALAAGIPCIGITTLEAVAAPAVRELRAGETLVAAIESKRAELFLQAFDGTLRPLSEPFAETPPAAGRSLPEGNLLLAGDGAERMRAALGARARVSSSGAPRAAAFALLAARRLAAGTMVVAPRPFYMRPPDARPMVGGIDG
jgi:tRNA threonylcarbamoyladenosine biosynthesis protein TsaB